MSTQRKLVYTGALLPFFDNCLRPKMTLALASELKVAGIDLAKPIPPVWTPDVFRHLWQISAKHLYGSLPEHEAMILLGREFLAGWQQSLMGRAAAMMLRVIGTKRALMRMTHNFRTSDNYTQVDWVEEGACQMRLHFHDVNEIPGWYQGIIEAGGELTKAKSLLVEVAERPHPGVMFRVTWSE